VKRKWNSTSTSRGEKEKEGSKKVKVNQDYRVHPGRKRRQNGIQSDEKREENRESKVNIVRDLPKLDLGPERCECHKAKNGGKIGKPGKREKTGSTDDFGEGKKEEKIVSWLVKKTSTCRSQDSYEKGNMSEASIDHVITDRDGQGGRKGMGKKSICPKEIPEVCHLSEVGGGRRV